MDYPFFDYFCTAFVARHQRATAQETRYAEKLGFNIGSGAAHFCTVGSSILNKWENTDKDFKNCKSFEKMVSESYICDTTLDKRKARGYKCDFAIKSFIIKDAVVIENRPDHIDSIGEEIFHKAVISFDPWHRKIIFQPYDM